MSPAAAPRVCPVCQGQLSSRLARWLRRCDACGLWASDLAPRTDAGASLDETHRAEGLAPLRKANFETVLDLLSELGPLAGRRVVDVGCAHGWFLEVATVRGMVACGVEPDVDVAETAIRRKLSVRVGPFPDVVADTDRYDVIAFNDVFEHLVDPHAVLSACAQRLAPGGHLVLNLPSSQGVLYRVACALARAGVRGPLERLWQRDFPSPHLWYFDARNLARLATPHGFRLERTARLATIRLSGLWPRLVMDRGTSRVKAAGIFAALALGYPGLRWLLPPDVMVQIYARGPTRR